MNTGFIDSMLEDYAEDGWVSEEKAFEVFMNCLSQDGLTQHEINYGFADEETLWDDFCNDTELHLV
jgi:hypothetical protein